MVGVVNVTNPAICFDFSLAGRIGKIGFAVRAVPISVIARGLTGGSHFRERLHVFVCAGLCACVLFQVFLHLGNRYVIRISSIPQASRCTVITEIEEAVAEVFFRPVSHIGILRDLVRNKGCKVEPIIAVGKVFAVSGRKQCEAFKHRRLCRRITIAEVHQSVNGAMAQHEHGLAVHDLAGDLFGRAVVVNEIYAGVVGIEIIRHRQLCENVSVFCGLNVFRDHVGGDDFPFVVNVLYQIEGKIERGDLFPCKRFDRRELFLVQRRGVEHGLKIFRCHIVGQVFGDREIVHPEHHCRRSGIFLVPFCGHLNVIVHKRRYHIIQLSGGCEEFKILRERPALGIFLIGHADRVGVEIRLVDRLAIREVFGILRLLLRKPHGGFVDLNVFRIGHARGVGIEIRFGNRCFRREQRRGRGIQKQLIPIVSG